VVRIERLTPKAMQEELTSGRPIGPASLYRALRTRAEVLGFEPHAVVDSLQALPEVVSRLDEAR